MSVINKKLNIGQLMYKIILLIETKVLQVNRYWKNQVARFFNPFSVGCLFFNLIFEDKFNEQTFFDDLTDFVYLHELLLDF